MPLLILLYPFAEFFAWYKFIDAFSFFDAFLFAASGFLLGLLIMMTQGRAALMQIQASLGQNKIPGNAILHRGMIMFGGLLILIPGLLSKIAGFLLVFPGFRHLSVWYLKWALAGKIAKGSFRVFAAGGFPGSGAGFSFKSDPSPPPAARDVVDITPNLSHTKKIDDTNN